MADDTRTPLLFLLEQGRDRPLDLALPPGEHTLRDMGVNMRFGDGVIEFMWQGFGPTAFVLPGARQLRSGRWTRADVGDNLSWAGRQWTFLLGSLDAGAIPAKGVLLNQHGGGHPVDAVALVEHGEDRGNFYRFRTAPNDLVFGVSIYADTSEDGASLWVKVADGAPKSKLSGKKLKSKKTAVKPEQTLHIAGSETHDAIDVLIIGR